MNVYDFDGTIYDGDSSIDFFKFCLKRNKKVLFILPSFILAIILYIIKIKEKEYLKSKFFAFVKYVENIDKEVEIFWDVYEDKIKKIYIENRKENDIVISASPEFLLKPFAKKYNVTLIATKVNNKTGELEGKNCYSEEKVLRLKKEGIITVKKFYSDSLSDKPIANLAENAYIVRKNKIYKWNEYKESKFKKIIKLFLDRDFVTFVAIGVVNAFNGVWLAYVYSLIVKDEIVGYILGFLTSLCISYLLNTFLNFKVNVCLKRFCNFAISNIPNFLIQIFCLLVIIKIFKLPKLVSYIITAVIAVPITYVLVKFKVFKNN